MAAASPESKPPRSLFDLPSDFFDSSALLGSHPSSAPSAAEPSNSFRPAPPPPLSQPSEAPGLRWTCNTCASEFESLQEQREHFKSDLHRLNVKLSIAGKTIIKEEDLDKADPASLFDDLEVSSVSGSEDELEGPASDRGLSVKDRGEFRKKLYFRCPSGDTVSVWRCALLKEHEEPFFNNKSGLMESHGSTSYVQEDEMLNRVKNLMFEPRDASRLRVILLTSGGHFAGCVFDGNSIIAHKTFHRYVVRAKAGKRQSGKDATGKVAHSAGSSLRRYNEAALKKEIQELIVSWKSYFDLSVCVFIYAPSKNRQMLFDGDKTQSILQACDLRPIPLTVHRPTLKEAKRVYSNLTQLCYEIEFLSVDEILPDVEHVRSFEQCKESKQKKIMDTRESIPVSSLSLDSSNKHEETSIQSSNNETTPLHEAAKSGNAQQTLELLEQGLDPCIKDARGKTPYMLAPDKEVRNTFRRFMALNLDKWDWHAADVPSALTKEMEESQAAKQAEKDAKKKARAKELKKLKKAKEKEKEKEKEKTQASQSQINVRGTSAVQMANATASIPGLKQKHQPTAVSKEEERQRKLAEEREERAAAAERRFAALATQSSSASGTAAAEPTLQRAAPDDNTCSCCFSSLVGKVPFHRYNYKYCSTTCMHLHSEMLEDD
ncbi:ankyrin repeat and zinc finger domain-containing protein 1 [Oryza brachyantha]|uniref:VLRF1 domain-containing protein n=1 Tax=Oryza brachyantha TaxID=4533 RepID=J3M0L5_ORYBR|nr:ankyrin repeat and zinc finger domain-containing protein 1 [Oryza brachyantha]